MQFDLAIKVRNPTREMMEFTHLKAVVTTVGGRRIVANRAQILAYTANIEFLEPGKWTTRRIAGGTDACDVSSGWALRPGKYQIYLMNPFAASPTHFTSPAIPLTVTS